MFGVLVVLLLGALIGWLGSVVLRQEERRAIVTNIALGTVGALLASILVEGTTLLAGVGPWALLAALIGAIAVVAGNAYVRQHVVR